MSSDEPPAPRPAAVLIATFVAICLLVGALHSDGHLTTRGAHGALAGATIGLTVATLAGLAVRYRGGLDA